MPHTILALKTKKDVTQKIRKGEPLFLLIRIVINIHQDFLYSYLVTGCTRRALETYQRDVIPKVSKESNHSNMCHTISELHSLLLSFIIIFQRVA